MTNKLLLRIAAACLWFFAFGHTIGHITRKDTNDENARKVLQLMSETKFDMFGQMRSYDENYTGMSLNLIVTLITLGILLWNLSVLEIENQKRMSVSILILILCMVGFSVTSFLYFFPLPAVSCLLAAIATGVAFFRIKTV